jgi:fluoroquinolone transport system permease protein
MVAVLRFMMPIAKIWLDTEYGVDIVPYYPLILSFFLLLEVPMLFGLVYGLLILDEKDDRALVALQVTPVSLDSYIFYRFIVTFLMSVVYIILTIMASGLLSGSQLLRLAPAVLLSGLQAVLILEILISLANNKVEGLAIMKGTGIMLIGPLVAFFLESNWEILLGVLPTYWPAKAFWLVWEGESSILYILIGLVYTLILITLLYRRFRRKYAL